MPNKTNRKLLKDIDNLIADIESGEDKANDLFFQKTEALREDNPDEDRSRVFSDLYSKYMSDFEKAKWGSHAGMIKTSWFRGG